MKSLLNLFHTPCAKNRPASRPHSARLVVEQLEERQLLSITDMTQLAQLFPPHVGPTKLYLNFDGGQTYHNISAYQSAPGGNRDADIQAVLNGVSRIYARYNLQVQRIYGYGTYDSSNNGNTTIFFGSDPNNRSNGVKYSAAFTPPEFVDAPGDEKGYNHRPHSDPYNLAFVDPVVQERVVTDLATIITQNWVTMPGAVNFMISAAVHEAGHTFGLQHVLTNPAPDIMSYDAPHQRFVSQTFNVTDLNYHPDTNETKHEGDTFFAKWNDNGTITKITTQNSYTYLMAVLGHHQDAAPVAAGMNQIVAANNEDGRLQEFVIGSDHALWSRWQLSPNSNSWSTWTSFGGWVQQITVGTDADGRMEVFAIGGDNALYDINQVAPSGSWTNWIYFGGWVTQISVGTDADGRMELFAIGGGNALYNINQVWPSSGWSSWIYFGNAVQKITVGCNADGRLEVFAIGASDNALYHIWQLSPGSGWSSWDNMGGWVTQITVGIDLDGRMEVFAIGGGNAMYDINQVVPSGYWTNWIYFGGWVTEITVARNADGHLEVFAIGGGNALYSIHQVAPNSGWSDWDYFGGSFRHISVASNADGRLEVFGVGVDNYEYDIWQTAPSSGWAGGYPSALP